MRETATDRLTQADVQVMDLATFFQKRADEKNWRAIVISGAMAPDKFIGALRATLCKGSDYVQ